MLRSFLKFRRDRMHAITALWTRIVDKDSFVPDVVKNLSSEEVSTGPTARNRWGN